MRGTEIIEAATEKAISRLSQHPSRKEKPHIKLWFRGNYWLSSVGLSLTTNPGDSESGVSVVQVFIAIITCTKQRKRRERERDGRVSEREREE